MASPAKNDQHAKAERRISGPVSRYCLRDPAVIHFTLMVIDFISASVFRDPGAIWEPAICTC